MVDELPADAFPFGDMGNRLASRQGMNAAVIAQPSIMLCSA